jgi:hypothetical protein
MQHVCNGIKHKKEQIKKSIQCYSISCLISGYNFDINAIKFSDDIENFADIKLQLNEINFELTQGSQC